jgi:hypothetical protein
MSANSSGREKRDRESPGLTSPLCKQSKMATSDIDGNSCASPVLSTSGLSERMDKMMEILMAVKKGQESLQKTFDSKIERLRNDVLSTIDDKIKAVKVDIELQFASLEKRICDLEIQFQSFKAIDCAPHDFTVNNCDITVIASNVPERQGKSALKYAQDLIDALGEEISTHVTIKDAKRCNNRNTGKPPLLKIAFSSVEEKVSVLRAKKLLKNNTAYKNVYLHSSKTHTERILELNAKTLLSELPNGNQFRVTANGRIVKKDTSSSDNNPIGRHSPTGVNRQSSASGQN